MPAYRMKSSTFVLNNDSAANFRIWVQHVIDMFTNAGWVQTADAGQINPVTVAAPSVNNTSMGYVIFRMADALQATFPVFVKVEFAGGELGFGARHGKWITIGTGSDGAGTITGQIMARVKTEIPEANPAFVMFSGDVNRCLFAYNYTTASTNFCVFGIERWKDLDWADNANGLLVALTGQSGGGGSLCNALGLTPSGTQPGAETSINLLIPAAGDTLDGANVGVYPARFFSRGKVVNSGLNFWGYRTNEIAQDITVALDVDGTPTDYLSTGAGADTRYFTATRNSNAVLLRY